MFKEGLQVYPLSKAQNPPAMQFMSGSEKAFNTIHANTYEFFEELNEVIQRDPVSFLDPELRGIFAAIGIEKGETFVPDGKRKNS